MTNILILLVFSFFVNACNPETPQEPTLNPDIVTYTNPIFKPVFADPAILDNRERDGYFYAYATQDNWGTEASTERRVPILRSSNLIKLGRYRRCFHSTNQLEYWA